MSILMLIFVVFLSDLLRNILKCNCSPYSTLITMYLPGAILCSNVLKPFIHLVNGHVVYVYWLDTVYDVFKIFSISYMYNTKSDLFSPKIKSYIYGNRKSNAKS